MCVIFVTSLLPWKDPTASPITLRTFLMLRPFFRWLEGLTWELGGKLWKSPWEINSIHAVIIRIQTIIIVCVWGGGWSSIRIQPVYTVTNLSPITFQCLSFCQASCQTQNWPWEYHADESTFKDISSDNPWQKRDRVHYTSPNQFAIVWVRNNGLWDSSVKFRREQNRSSLY